MAEIFWDSCVSSGRVEGWETLDDRLPVSIVELVFLIVFRHSIPVPEVSSQCFMNFERSDVYSSAGFLDCSEEELVLMFPAAYAS
jgi:hypothetical protein